MCFTLYLKTDSRWIFNGTLVQNLTKHQLLEVETTTFYIPSSNMGMFTVIKLTTVLWLTYRQRCSLLSAAVYQTYTQRKGNDDRAHLVSWLNSHQLGSRDKQIYIYIVSSRRERKKEGGFGYIPPFFIHLKII